MENATLTELRRTLTNLAASPVRQREYLRHLGVNGLVDELALEFDDAYRPAATQLDDRVPEVGVACRELDRMLSDDELDWDPDALEGEPWANVRSLASGILELLDARSREFDL